MARNPQLQTHVWGLSSTNVFVLRILLTFLATSVVCPQSPSAGDRCTGDQDAGQRDQPRHSQKATHTHLTQNVINLHLSYLFLSENTHILLWAGGDNATLFHLVNIFHT